jgi:hypothetical protein
MHLHCRVGFTTVNTVIVGTVTNYTPKLITEDVRNFLITQKAFLWMPYLTHKVALRNFKFSKYTVPCTVQKAQPLVHILNVLYL